MSEDITTAPVIVLRHVDRGLVHGVKLRLTDRGGTVLAAVDEPFRWARLCSLDGFGGARNGARRVVVSRPDGAPFLHIDKPWNPLRRPASVRDANGMSLGTIRQISVLRISPRFDIADPAGSAIGAVSGSLQALSITDADGRLIAEIFREGDAQVLVTRMPAPEPLRMMVIAALVTVRLMIWGARIDRSV